MNDDVQTIVTLIVLLVALFLFISPFLIFFVYVFFQNSKRKQIRERIHSSQQQLIAGRECVPLRYASEARFKALFKIFPWDGAGVMVASPGNVAFIGETLSGVPISLQLAPGQALIKWLGKCPWPNGAVSWFQFDLSGEKYFFTSETGAFIFGSNKSTKAAYDLAQRSLG